MKLFSGACHVTNWWVNIGSGDGLVPWLGAIRQQTINWANVDPDLSCHMVSLCHNELTCQCVYITSTFCFSAFMTFSFCLIFLEYMYHQLTPHTHDLALFHQILLNRGVVFIFPFFSYLFYLFYLVLILWMWLEGNFAYGTSALLPWHVYTSVVNQLESHFSD